MEEKIKHYFETYKDSLECFVTADDFIFHKRTDATAHAATLADKKVSAYTRAEVEAEKPKADKPKVEKPKVDKPKAGTEGTATTTAEGEGNPPPAVDALTPPAGAEGNVPPAVDGLTPPKAGAKSKSKVKAVKK